MSLSNIELSIYIKTKPNSNSNSNSNSDHLEKMDDTVNDFTEQLSYPEVLDNVVTRDKEDFTEKLFVIKSKETALFFSILHEFLTKLTDQKLPYEMDLKTSTFTNNID